MVKVSRRGLQRRVVLGAAVLAAVVLTQGPAAATTYVPISGAGSTWSFNAISAWSRNVAQFGIPVNYNPLGSTTGRNEFRNGTVDWAASDIPYGVPDGTNNDPPPSRGFAYVPDTAGGLSFVYNLAIGGHRVTNLRLSGPVIAGIFTGTITMWNDPAIATDNPNLALPAIRITPVVRSDGDGSTAQFTQWMVATQPSAWQAYCQRVGRTPCTQTSTYPVLPGSGIVAQSGDLGVSGYVGQQQADGAIGYVEYSYALQTGFPVAKVLNAAGYYTSPTPGHVAVSLLDARINMNQTDPSVYLTEDLSQVYTDPDPRTYPLSGYSYLIVPTATGPGFTTDKGFTLGDFGKYLLCQGQNQVDALGYAALPINLVQAGLDQLKRIPGANIPNFNLETCNNPTFSTDGTNTLAATDPFPAACDKQGTTQCANTVATATRLTADPATTTAGTPVTLTATVTAADPAGHDATGQIRFANGTTLVGTATVSGGTATLPVASLPAGTNSITATFVPTDPTAFAGSVSAPVTVTIDSAAQNEGQETINVDIAAQSSGSLTLTVDGTPVTMSTPTNIGTALESTGSLSPVTISDTRAPDQPGWDVTGSVGAFTSGANTFSGNALGWTPSITTADTANDVTPGPTIAANNPGLGTSAALADTAPGHGAGTTVLGARLDLRLPFTTPTGSYGATLTVTLLSK